MSLLNKLPRLLSRGFALTDSALAENRCNAVVLPKAEIENMVFHDLKVVAIFSNITRCAVYHRFTEKRLSVSTFCQAKNKKPTHLSNFAIPHPKIQI